MIQRIEKLAHDVGHALNKKGLKIATAESCTGGGLSYWITSVAGSSNWFERGFITYSNEAKIEILGVNPVTLEKFGSVSESTVLEMAEGALQKSHADIAIATTGIAGPDGGSEQKPVGTVWIAWATRNKMTQTLINIYSGDRQKIRLQTIEVSLSKLLSFL